REEASAACTDLVRPQDATQRTESFAQSVEPPQVVSGTPDRVLAQTDTSDLPSGDEPPLPAPGTRRVVLGLALVGLALIVVYVLDYWTIIELPF
ncbi:MAG: hypothetical protein LBP28_00710, partial [Coriobacteriales bacterium]|nr:hypothetical protein [Coriobacteriales bacterium]